MGNIVICISERNTKFPFDVSREKVRGGKERPFHLEKLWLENSLDRYWFLLVILGKGSIDVLFSGTTKESNYFCSFVTTTCFKIRRLMFSRLLVVLDNRFGMGAQKMSKIIWKTVKSFCLKMKDLQCLLARKCFFTEPSTIIIILWDK